MVKSGCCFNMKMLCVTSIENHILNVDKVTARQFFNVNMLSN